MALRGNKDAIVYKTRPKYLKHPDTGRIFVATDGLIDRGDMIAVDGPDEKKPKNFQLSKASKQDIVNEAGKHGTVLKVTDKLKTLKAQFKALKVKPNASDNPDSSTGS